MGNSQQQQENDPLYGSISFVQVGLFNLAFKDIRFSYKKEYLKALQFYENRFYSLNYPNIFIIHTMKNFKLDQFFHEEFAIQLYIDYPIRTFAQEIIQRKPGYYHEFFILNFLDSLIGALAFLQAKGISHQNLSFDNIYLVAVPKYKFAIKIMDPYFIPYEKNNLEKFREEQCNNRFLYLSPEQLKAVNDEQQNNYNPYKSDVFILGMLVLELCTLNKCNEIYDIKKWVMKVDVLNDYLVKTQDKYSDDIVQILRVMLQISPKYRPDFLDLDDMLYNFIGKRIKDVWKQQNYQFIPSNGKDRQMQLFNNAQNAPLTFSKISEFSSIVKKSDNSLYSKRDDIFQQQSLGIKKRSTNTNAQDIDNLQ